MLDTCGEASPVAGFGSGRAIDVSASGALFSWGTEIISAAAGSFRLCWCAAGFACAAGESFQVDIGTLLVLGLLAGLGSNLRQWSDMLIFVGARLRSERADHAAEHLWSSRAL